MNARTYNAVAQPHFPGTATVKPDHAPLLAASMTHAARGCKVPGALNNVAPQADPMHCT
jgi:hypothetical protein